jgi:hypothetical protein
MNPFSLASICRQIYKKFPEVNGALPRERAQGSQTLLIFEGSAQTANGKTIKRVVRVVVSDEGKIVKTTTSR